MFLHCQPAPCGPLPLSAGEEIPDADHKKADLEGSAYAVTAMSFDGWPLALPVFATSGWAPGTDLRPGQRCRCLKVVGQGEADQA
jgi:hypothetical protein